MDPLVTIQNLIALACGSHSEEEARTSALAACKAIKRHGVILTLSPLPRASIPASDPFSPFTNTRPAPPPPRPATPPPPKSTPTKKPDTPKREQEKVYRSGTKMYEDESRRPRRVVAKYEAYCQGCGVECEVGTAIWWRKGLGVTCMTCGPKKLTGNLDVEV